MKYDIKADHHIRAKRKCLAGLNIGLLLLFQAVRVLWHFPENEGWRNALAGGERSDMAAAVRRVILEVSETDAAVKTETN